MSLLPPPCCEGKREVPINNGENKKFGAWCIILLPGNHSLSSLSFLGEHPLPRHQSLSIVEDQI